MRDEKANLCPACRKSSVVVGDMDQGYFVECCQISCGMSGPYSSTPLEAIKIWNSIRIHSKDSEIEKEKEKSKCEVCGCECDRDWDEYPPGNIDELIESFEEWLDATGAIDRGNSWYVELKSFFDYDARGIVENARKGSIW